MLTFTSLRLLAGGAVGEIDGAGEIGVVVGVIGVVVGVGIVVGVVVGGAVAIVAVIAFVAEN